MKSINHYLIGAGVLAVAAGFASCADELAGEVAAPSREVAMHVVLTKDGGAAESRTAFEESAGNLACVWTAGDKIVVAAADGTKLGTLTIDDNDAGKKTARFEGKIEVSGDDEQTMNFIYLGNKTDAEAAVSPVAFSYAEQSGTMEGLSDYDFFSQSATVNVASSEAFATVDAMQRRVAFGRFALALPAGVAYSGETVTVSGSALYTTVAVNFNADNAAFADAGTITTKADADGELYLTLLPATTDLTFTTTIGDATYSYTLPEREWKAGEYVRAKNADGTFSGVRVELAAPVVEPADEDLTGPTFEVDGRKFRFTKANLAYNVPDKRWYLLDEQYSFLCKKGWAYANGNYYGAKENDIDLFGFGCTGLHFSYFNDRLQTPTQFDEPINAPEYFIEKQLYANQSINGTQQGYKYPTQNATCNEGYTGSNLEFGIQGFTMDWGTAYGQQQNDGGTYFTLKASEWSDIQAKYFMCGATITDVKNPNTNKNGLYGCIILPVNTVAEAKALLTGNVTIASKPTFNGTDYQFFNYNNVNMNLEQFKALEAADKIVFLPEAGHTSVTLSYTKTDGYYWTATAGQAYTSTIFRFDGDSTPKVFKLDSQSSRIFGCSVRLVKEVK